MKIAQIVLPGASEYERKSQRADFAALSEAGHQVGVYDVPRNVRPADVAHVYGPSPLPRAAFRGFHIPFVANAPLQRWPFGVRRSPEPRLITLDEVPEAVEEKYWPDVGRASARPDGLKAVPHGVIGTFSRESIRSIVAQTAARLHRTRDDVDWRLYDHPPSPEEIAAVDVWVDPAVEESDLDGFVAEAMVAGKIAVASRTMINAHRMEQGRTGLLVRCNDANELTHAILAARFKTELGLSKLSAAKQTLSKFRPRRRARALCAIYESLLR